MVRCGCASDRCSCTIIGGDGVVISGSGSPNDPYVASAVFPESGGGDGSGRFSGEMTEYAGPVAPAGWLTCDGAEVSRTVYASLFAVIGVAYGSGDGVTTFNLPDRSGRFAIGLSGDFARGQVGGSEVLTEEMLPEHTHPIDHDHPSVNSSSNGLHDHDTGHNNEDGGSASTFREGNATGRTVDTSLVVNAGAHSHSVNVPAYVGDSGPGGSADPDPSLPPWVSVHVIIKT